MRPLPLGPPPPGSTSVYDCPTPAESRGARGAPAPAALRLPRVLQGLLLIYVAHVGVITHVSDTAFAAAGARNSAAETSHKP